MATYEEALTLESLSDQSELEISQASLSLDSISAQNELETSQASLSFDAISDEMLGINHDLDLDLDSIGAMYPNITVNAITWNIGEKIYLDNQYKMSDGKIFGFNKSPDDIVEIELIS